MMLCPIVTEVISVFIDSFITRVESYDNHINMLYLM